VGINNTGEIIAAGETGPGSDSQLYQFTNGQVTLVQTANGQAAGINNFGNIATTALGETASEALLYDPASTMFTKLGFTQDENSYATGINDNDQVIANASVGQTSTGFAIYHPFLWDPVSGLQDLGTSPSFFGLASGINAHGDVVGTYNQSSASGSFVYTGGTLYDLQSLIEPVSGTGWSNLVAYQINDVGQIVGFGTHNGQTRAFLLTPDVSAAPTITIRSAHMADAHDLAISVTAKYPQAGAGRWISFALSINGTSINPTTAPAACLYMVKSTTNLSINESIEINLANFDGQGHAVPRFTSDIVAGITCQAGGPGEANGSASRKLAILLPVVILPGLSPVDTDATGGDGSNPGLEKYLKSQSKALLQAKSFLGSPFAVSSDGTISYPTIYTLNYRLNIDDFATAAKKLDQLITGTIQSRTYASAVNLVGHSKGCLVGRQYMVSTPSVVVPRFIMCAPPNLGSVWAVLHNFGENLSNLTPVWPWERSNPGKPYQPSNNPQLEALNQIPLPSTTSYTIVYSTTYPTSYLETDFGGPRLQFKVGDLIVPAFSALGELPDPNHPHQAPTLIPAFAGLPIEEVEIGGLHWDYVSSNKAALTAIFSRLTSDIN
jgi:probable HAF family extracellular repeat protein